MIQLTRLNGQLLAVNADLIQFMEATPDTTLTLIHGEKVVVRETPDEVIERGLEYRARLMGAAARVCPGGLILLAGSAWRATAALEAGAETQEWESGELAHRGQEE